MTGLIILLCILLIAVIVVQIGRVSEIAGRIRGEEEIERDNNRFNGAISLIFMVLFLIGCVVSAVYYKDSMLGYGPHISASAHGITLDRIFNITLFFTGIVFVLTHIALFYFAWKYQGRPGRKARYMPHDNKLEVIWTIIPAVVMTFLVVGGLDAWNEVMADVNEDEDYIEIEATGMQFAWMLRHPGADGLLGTKNYKMITANNPMGMDWEDEKNHDDVVSLGGDIFKLPVGKKVRVRITSRDVLHNFDMPHFRVKMDAVPGLPTYFVFTPTITTEEYRTNLGAVDKNGDPMYPEWWVPADPSEPDGPMRWETFEYELACAELCGNGHYSMRRVFQIVSQEEYDEWAAGLPSYYMSTIRNSDEDPYKGQLLGVDIKARGIEFKNRLDAALASSDVADKILRFDYVNFETASFNLTPDSRYELENLEAALKKFPNMTIELSGHTDNVGTVEGNRTLSQNRAEAVMNFLASKGVSASRMTAVGYGDTVPVESNDTEEGRAENRRTEFKIINQ